MIGVSFKVSSQDQDFGSNYFHDIVSAHRNVDSVAINFFELE